MVLMDITIVNVALPDIWRAPNSAGTGPAGLIH
jgi:hypothetical protein